jgi:hypothetical protein
MSPLVRTHWVHVPVKQFIKAYMDKGYSRKTAKQAYNVDRGECWNNDLYVVMLKRPENVSEAEGFILPDGFVWLSIRRTDREPIFDWRHMQQIKNQLVGDECEAVQIFPAESRLVDTCNQYHLIACADPEARMPMGFTNRTVSYGDADFLNARQRKGVNNDNAT